MNKQFVNSTDPQITRNEGSAPTDPKAQQQNQPKEGSIRKVDESVKDTEGFDGNNNVGENDANNNRK